MENRNETDPERKLTNPVPNLFDFQPDLLVANESHPVIVFEFLGFKTLDWYIDLQEKFPYPKTAWKENEKLWAGVTAMFFEPLVILYTSNHSHGDLKGVNMMFTEDWQAKLIDFGFSEGKKVEGDKVKGTRVYMAPEIHEGNQDRRGSEIDLFAFGVQIFHMVTKDFPWPEATAKKPKEG